MNKKVFKIFACLLTIAMVLGALTACGGSGSSQKDGKIVYTYRAVWSAGPLNWNPHAWEMNNDDALKYYLETSLVDVDFGEKPGEWKWIYAAANDVQDITESFADKAKYNIPADAKNGRVFQIDLDPSMKWQTGEQITADDYIYSMQMLLDPTMKNYRSNTYCTGDTALYNAQKYMANDLAGKEIYKPWNPEEGGAPKDAKLVFSLKDETFFFGEPAKTTYKSSKDKFTVNNVDLYQKYKDKDVIEINDATKADMLAIAASFGDTNPEAWKEFQVYPTGEKYKETPWSDVGLLKTGDYQIVYITAAPVQMFYMMSNLTSNWLVHKATYEKTFEMKEDLKTTSYGTDLANTMSYGPYKLVTFEVNKQIRLERNPYWGGYHNKKNEGMYQADAVVIDIIENHATQLQRFGQGLVDEQDLNSDDLEKYKKSDRLVYTDETYTDRFIFATSDEALNHRDQEKGSGKRIVMRYKDFRKAISLSMDREKYCREATSGYKPAFFLLNSLYYYDMANDPNSIYRNTYYAKKAILDLYGIDSSRANADANYAKLTGRDIGLAKELFTKAYNQAVADGVYKDGEIVPIEVMASPSELTPQHIKQQDLMQEFIDEGTKGTPFEGKVKIKYESGDPKRYDNVAIGKNMAIRGAWGGAPFYPFSVIRLYTNPEFMGGLNKIHESNGWDPTKEKITISIDMVDGSTHRETMSFADWSTAVNPGGKYDAEHWPVEQRLQILAALEHGVLAAYQCIPIGTYTDATIVSYKIDYGTDVYNIMYGYGGFRRLKFNYTDAEWEAYLKKNQGQLNYE